MKKKNTNKAAMMTKEGLAGEHQAETTTVEGITSAGVTENEKESVKSTDVTHKSLTVCEGGHQPFDDKMTDALVQSSSVPSAFASQPSVSPNEGPAGPSSGMALNDSAQSSSDPRGSSVFLVLGLVYSLCFSCA